MSTKIFNIDLRVGGLGDIWMRACALYTASKLHPQFRISCAIPPALQTVCTFALGERLQFSDNVALPCVTFTTRGLRHLLPQAVRGKRFVVPYHRVVIKDWNKRSYKDQINMAAFDFFNHLGWTQLPPWTALEHYQGYFEVVSIAQFRDLEWSDFLGAAKSDYEKIFERLNSRSGHTRDILASVDDVAVFPSGTAHQFMPAGWAKKHLPDATFHLHEKDSLIATYTDLGLRVNRFSTAEEIIKVALRSRYLITTDSFPSHIVQYCSERAAIVLCEASRVRIVSPFFRGTVIDSAAPCSPCPHLGRRDFPLCKAGQESCLTWGSASTVAQIRNYLTGSNARDPMVGFRK